MNKDDSFAPAAVCPERIIVLDDEAELRNMLNFFLTAQGFQVRTVGDSARLERKLERESFDLLVLDLMMEPEDGLSICRRLRAQGQTIPILMLTARGDPVDKVIGLESGADDYLAKPFLPRELVARIRAILRRRNMLEGVTSSTPRHLRFGDFEFYRSRQQLVRNGAPVSLNSAESRLLDALATTPNRPISRDNLMVRARGREYEASGRSVDVQVQRLRQVIEDDSSHPHHIRTVWGLGYMLVAEVVP
ncbi:response regulator [Pararobbsia alpina]|uniref:Transcriptional regulatory protein OmpR n=1 Tax=Pararobbsia alpina TaxID=621374 RepID=A0A6S7D0C7_9BURK|nr:response regulator [Pararobbsia alpina]CAB3802599.1 Transcriptional regulatory protein OmpR [Pararobbsia alpina]